MTPLTPADLRAGIATALVLYLPGIFLARRLARASRTPLAAWALPASLALLLSGLFLGQILGLDLPACGWILWLLALGGTLFGVVDALHGRGVRGARPREGGVEAAAGEGRLAGSLLTGGSDPSPVRAAEWLLIFVAVLILGATGGPLGLRFDSLDHLAAIRRSLLSGSILPLDEFYRGGDGQGWDPRKGFFPAMLAWICRITRSDPLHVWRLLPAVLAPGILLSLSQLMRGWLGSGRRSDLALAAWLLVGSGSGLLWLSRAGYPNHPAYALAFFAIGLWAARLRGGPLRGSLAGIALLAYVAELMHLVPGMVLGLAFALGCLAALAVPESRPESLRSGLGAGLAAGCGLLLPGVFRWLHQGPLVSTLHTHDQGLLVLGHGIVVASPLFILFYSGWVVVVALLVLPWAARRAEGPLRPALIALTLGPWILVATPVFTLLHPVLGYLPVRFLDVIPAVPVLILALSESWVRIRGRGTGKGRVASILAGLLVAGFLASALTDFPSTVRRAARDVSGRETVAPFAGALRRIPRERADGTPPVVLADAFTSYAVPAIHGGYVISTLDQHGPPTDARWRVRLDDQRDMLYGGRGDAAADSLLRFYDVDYVFLNRKLPIPFWQFGAQVTEEMLRTAQRRFRADPERFPVLDDGPEGTIFAVRKEAPSAWAASRLAGSTGATDGAPEPAPAATTAAADDSASSRLSSATADLGPLQARDVELPHGVCRPGSHVPVRLRWLRTGPVQTDLPLWLHLRCIGPSPERWYIRRPFDRPGRLLAQALDHRVYRFRIAVRPLEGVGNLRLLPLNTEVPDTLSLFIPRTAVAGRYAVQLRLAEETFLPNLVLHDLLRDDELGDAPVVGWIEVGP